MSSDSSNKHPIGQERWSDAEQSVPTTLPYPRVLAVAMTVHAIAVLPRHVMAPDATVRLVSLTDLSVADVTGGRAPDLLLAPLISRGFDATDLLNILRVHLFWADF